MALFDFPARRVWQALLDQLVPRRRGPLTRSRLRLELLEDRLAPAVFNVTASGGFSAAINTADSNQDTSNTIRLAPGAYAVVNQLIKADPSKTLRIVGQGAVLTANQPGRIFEINANVQLENLTVTGGSIQGVSGGAAAQGGGLLIDGGQVTLNQVTVRGNTVRGADGPTGPDAWGGGIFMAGGNLTLLSATIQDNHVIGGNGTNGGDGGAARGGGLAAFGSDNVIAFATTISGNDVTGGHGGVAKRAADLGGSGGEALGGGFYSNTPGDVNLVGCTLANDRALGGAAGDGLDGLVGGQGGAAGRASGGGIASDGSGLAFTLYGGTVSGCTAVGGRGGNAGRGSDQGPLGSGGDFAGPGGDGGKGGAANGGGIGGLFGNLALVNTIIVDNSARGGDGGNGGAAGKGGDGAQGAKGRDDWDGLNGQSSTDPGLGADGGPGGSPNGGRGGNAGDASGGGCFATFGFVTLLGASLSSDTAQGGVGGPGGPGGDGGKGGNGGNAGSASYFQEFSIRVTGGYGGNGGYGGKGGDGGSGGRGGSAHGGAVATGAQATVYLYGGSASGTARGGDGGAGGPAGKGNSGGDQGGTGQGELDYYNPTTGAYYLYRSFVNGSAGYAGVGGSSQGGDGGSAFGGAAFLNGMALPTLDGITTTGGTVLAGAGGVPGKPGIGGPGAPAGDAHSGGDGVTGGSLDYGAQGVQPLTSEPAPPTHLIVSPLPPNVAAGSRFAYPVYVLAVDDLGRLAGDYTGSVTVRLAQNFTNAVLRGTPTVRAVNGVAVFDDLSLDRAGVAFTLPATASGGVQATPTIDSTPSLQPFDALGPNVLAFVQQPHSAVVGKTIAPPIQVEVEDRAGLRRTDYRGHVTLLVGGHGTVSGTIAVSVVNGLATFANVKFTKAATGTFLVPALDDGTTIIGDSLDVTKSQLVVIRQPPKQVKVGQPFTLTVASVDFNGNPYSQAHGSVFLQLGNNPGGASLGGQLDAQLVNGVAQFTGLTVNAPGTGYTLVATTNFSDSATSPAFDVGPKLVVTVEPPRADHVADLFDVRVAALDLLGKLDTSFTGPVTIALGGNAASAALVARPFAAGGATLGGKLTVNAIGGIADFANLVIDTAGTGFDLTATSAGLAPVTTDLFDVDLDVTLTWTGRGDGKWSDPKDWDLQTAPQPGDNLVFPRGASTSSSNDLAGLTVNNVLIAGGYFLSGNAITVTGALTDTASLTQYYLPTTLTGTATTFTIAANAVLVVLAPLDGAGGLTKTGPGTLALAKNDAYQGPTTLQQGTLNLRLAGGLGTGALLVQPLAAPGATLEVTAGLTLANPVTFAGETLTLRNNLTLSGPVTVASNATINTSKGNLTLTGSLSGDGGNTLAVTGTGKAVLAGTLDRSARVSVFGGGSVELGQGLTGDGALVVADRESTLFARHTLAFAGTITAYGGTIDVQGKRPLGTGTLVLAAAAQLGIGVPSGQTAQLDNPLECNGGTLDVYPGALVMTRPVTVNADSRIDAHSRVTLQDGLAGLGTLTVADDAQVTLQGELAPHTEVAIAGRAHLTLLGVTGSGSIRVNGDPGRSMLESVLAPEYSGTITFNSGTIAVAAGGNLGTGALIIPATAKYASLEAKFGNSPADFNPGHPLLLQNPLLLQGGNLVTSGSVTFTQAVTVAGTSELVVYEPALALTLAGPIAGSGTLQLLGGTTLLDGALDAATRVTVVGTATLQLGQHFSGSGALTLLGGTLVSVSTLSFTGIVTLKAGTIHVGANNALGSGPLVIDAAKGIVTLDGPEEVIGLGNSLQLLGGTLHINADHLTVFGVVKLVQNSVLDALADASLTLGDILGSGSLTLEGAITVTGTTAGTVHIIRNK